MNPVILNSLPKSGTHVLVRLFELLGYTDSELHLSGSLVRDYKGRNIVKKICKKCVLNYDRPRLQRLEVDLDFSERTISKQRLLRILRKMKENRFCEAHVPYSSLLERTLSSEGLKVVYIVRDPRDVALSYINHVERDPEYPYHKKMNELRYMSEKIEFVLSGDGGEHVLSSLSQRVDNSVGWKNAADCCFVRFEDIIGPEGGGEVERQVESVARIMKYIGADTSIIDINEICRSIFYRKAETFNHGKIGRHSDLDNESVLLLNAYLSEQIRILDYVP